MITAGQAESYESGTEAGAGSYKCRSCGLRIGLDGHEEVPRCPACGETHFRRAPLFESATRLGEPKTLERQVVPESREEPPWLTETRELLDAGGRYLVFEEGRRIRVVPLEVGWSRIGRSTSADIRLDDPTVSRRHALVVRTAGGEVRVLDDRSLNGVQLNGERVEWGSLSDGDELAVGRFRLYLVALEPAGSRDSEPAVASG
jgi:hypothetical protein